MKDSASIVKGIQLTEKATVLGEKENKYMFKVHPNANKIEIKKAVENIYNVSVVGVNTMRYQGKRKRERTVRFGKRSDWKRAVVTLKDGDKIDLT